MNREMIDSGIEWIGQVPSTWKMIPNKYLFIEHCKKVGDNWKNYQLLSLTTKGIKEKDINSSGGKVPDSIEELCKFRGVGSKTANLVMSLGFGKPAICVDVHVHRIFNRLGYIQTKNPEETEFALREKLPVEYWIPINTLLVTHGQNVCKPIKPMCDVCPVGSYCNKLI